jgi:glutamate-1-semialdehyde aminotransferase
VITGYAPMPYLHFDDNPIQNETLRHVFLAEMAKRGILFQRGVSFVTAAHSREDIEFTIEASREALATVQRVTRTVGGGKVLGVTP